MTSLRPEYAGTQDILEINLGAVLVAQVGQLATSKAPEAGTLVRTSVQS